SKIMDTKGPKMLQRDYTPQARLSQHLKDVRLMLAAAGDATALPLTRRHAELLELAELLGWGEQDNSALREALPHWRPAPPAPPTA
ncbi:MAG: NAD-binding protein, partial [Planctomycetaceae bacterium]